MACINKKIPIHSPPFGSVLGHGEACKNIYVAGSYLCMLLSQQEGGELHVLESMGMTMTQTYNL